jgi:hypothetical protein
MELAVSAFELVTFDSFIVEPVHAEAEDVEVGIDQPLAFDHSIRCCDVLKHNKIIRGEKVKEFGEEFKVSSCYDTVFIEI